jgi:Ca2+-binding EF-hand superfamily protein
MQLFEFIILDSRDIDFDEFCRIMEPAIRGSFNRDELYQAFKHFDKVNINLH